LNPTQTLLDEAAITRMILDYAAWNDAGDWDAVAALYVPEGRMSRPVAPDDFVEGRDAILAAFKARPPRTTRHICANIRVDVEGDTASASSQIMLFTAAGQPPLVGSYADRLVRTADGWRFVERRGSLDFPA
jgi:ketosteroid isomerase-like protein